MLFNHGSTERFLPLWLLLVEKCLTTHVVYIYKADGTSGKEAACQCRRHKRCGMDPWVGKIPWRRAWQPTPVFLPGDSPWTEEPGRLQSIGSHRVRHDWSNLAHMQALLWKEYYLAACFLETITIKKWMKNEKKKSIIWNIRQTNFIYVLLFWLVCAACRILVPSPGVESMPLTVKLRSFKPLDCQGSPKLILFLWEQ